MAALLHADAGVTATVAGLCDLVLESAERAIACLPDEAPVSVRCQAHSIHGMGLALKGRTAEAARGARPGRRTAVARSSRSRPRRSRSRSRSWDGSAPATRSGCWRRPAAWRRPPGRAARSGSCRGFSSRRPTPAYRLGDWDDAEREADDAVENAEVSGQLGPLTIALIIRARIHAARGREPAARADAHRGVEIAEPVGYGSVRLWSLACLGFLELGNGAPAEAIEELEQAQVLAGLSGLEDPLIIPWAPDLVEAYVRCGRAAEAAS